jgi:outer membrane protein assembly factor BamB
MVVGDRLLVASCAGWFYALDRGDGTELWSFDIRREGGSQFHDEMLVLDDRVVIGTDGRRGNTHALDLETGAELWRRPCGKAMRADLLGIDDRVIGIAREEEVDRLFSVRTTDGSDVWTVDLPRTEGVSSYDNAPVRVAGDAIALGTTDGRVVAYEADTGELAWECAVGEPIVRSLLHRDGKLYGGTKEGRIFRVDVASRTVDASIQLEGRPKSVPADLGNSIGVLLDWRSRDATLVVLDEDLGTIQWTWSSEGKNDFGTIARLYRRDDTVLVGTEQGRILALDLADGSTRWQVKVDEGVRSLGFHDDMMYVGTIPGAVYAIRLDGQTSP